MQNAQLKLQQLEEKLGKGQKSETKDHEDTSTPVIPLPDWADKNRQAERDRERSRTSSEGVEDKSRHEVPDFRHSSQVSILKNSCQAQKLDIFNAWRIL